MDPLIVAGRCGEGVDAFLVDDEPLGHGDFLADPVLEPVDAGYYDLGHVRAAGSTRLSYRKDHPNMLLADLLAASERVSATRSRLAKVDALSECLRKLEPPEIALGVAYLSGDIRQGKIGIGYAGLKEALAAAPAAAPEFTLLRIDEDLERLSRVKGRGSAGKRGRLLSSLFTRATAPEQDFLARLLLGELRQGALEGIMHDAIAKAANLPPARVRSAAMRAGGLPAVALAGLTEGEAGLARFALTVFQPVQPMLAQPAGDIDDALERLGTAAFEWKLDGARVQAHKSGDEIRVYTRSLNEVTAAVPEVVAALRGSAARELAPSLPGDHAPLRPQARRGIAARDLPLVRLFLRLPARGRRGPHREIGAGALRSACARAAGGRHRSAPRDGRPRRGAGVLRSGARARPRGRDGESAGGALRSGQPRRRLAEGQARARARPRRHRGRMGERPPQGLALQPAPRRARPGDRRFRDAREDLQGDDRPDARLADRAAALARDLARGPRRARAARARRRDRVQRDPGEPDLSRRIRPALRAREALPRGQEREGSGHHRDRAIALREPDYPNSRLNQLLLGRSLLVFVRPRSAGGRVNSPSGRVARLTSLFIRGSSQTSCCSRACAASALASIWLKISQKGWPVTPAAMIARLTTRNSARNNSSSATSHGSPCRLPSRESMSRCEVKASNSGCPQSRHTLLVMCGNLSRALMSAERAPFAETALLMFIGPPGSRTAATGVV